MNTAKLNIERLIECRKALGITKMEAAKRIGLSQPAYLRYESGERNPSIHVIKEIAAVFQTSVDYLIGEAPVSEPEVITINKQTQPEVFELVSACREMNAEQYSRLLAYAEKLKSE